MIASKRAPRGWRNAAPWIAPRFLGVSLLAHAAAIWLFRVFDPITPTLAATPPPVRLSSPDSPEGRAFLAWVAANDPAEEFRFASRGESVVPKVAFRPSFAGGSPEPATVSDEPPIPPSLPFSLSRSSPAPRAAPIPQPSSTRWIFAGNLAARALDTVWQPPSIASGETLKPARFLVAADARGEIRFVILEERSGNPATDRAAASALLAMKLRPASADLEWGTATVHWGSDLYR